LREVTPTYVLLFARGHVVGDAHHVLLVHLQ